MDDLHPAEALQSMEALQSLGGAQSESLLDRRLLRADVARPSWSYKFWTLALFASGAIALALGIFYINATGEPHRAFVVTAYALRFYVFAGLYLSASALVGVYAALAPLPRKRLLHVYVGLLGLAIVIMVCASIWIWTGTLNINQYYGRMWRNDWPDEIKLMFQDQNQCCGYLGPADSPVASSSACSGDAHGCMYPVILYVMACHRYVYAGLICFSLVSLFSATTGMLLIIDCNAEQRVRRSLAHHWRRRVAERAARRTESFSSNATFPESRAGYYDQ
ncbi:hypothetical protein H4R18_002716 [Coemansia javaensis]|uniref:Tetraspanin n=1 Tax=Coemansia javaensis TaxID=2761396 RepID=A0A9W8HEA3_9FUNG|nr:hypothetical protein H4R18_002716 [Coemansia javaensis]